MVDVVDKATRSRMMAGIRGVNTVPEIDLRRALHAAGFRYRIHAKELPGKPDLVFPRFGAVVFVHGCFWHRHAGCKWATTPSTNTAFWEEKLNRNVERDARSIDRLRKLDWRVAVVWECAMRVLRPEQVVEAVGEWLVQSDKSLVLPQRPLGRVPKGQ
jgi:DNA mismatch endonuclease (patch repair protein)